MAGIDATIPLGAKAPDGMATIGSMVALARGAQQLQLGKVELQKNEIALGERQGIQDLFSQPERFQTSDGQMDFNKLIEEGMKVAPTTFPTMIPSIIQARTAGIAAEQALSNLNESTRAGASQWFMAQKGKPLDQVASEAEGIKKLNPALAPAIDNSLRVLALANKNGGQAALDATYLKLGQSAMSPAQQATAIQPSGPTMSSGQVTKVVNTNPMAGNVGDVIPGTTTQQQLPPNTPVYNPETQTPGYLGAQGSGAPRTAKLEVTQPSRQIQSGPKLGTEANVAGTVEAVNKDWNATAEQARTASQDIGVLQNIKKFATGAITGVAGDRRAYLAGLAGLLHMDAAQLEKTDTDLLAKNTNMLALAGGDTNLAKLMAESANPNTHMTPQAIEDAANQVIAQRRLALARQSYMQHFKGDPELYSKELSNFNSFADPRILQLPDLSPQEKARMKAAMSPSEQREFGQKIRKMQAAGIVQ